MSDRTDSGWQPIASAPPASLAVDYAYYDRVRDRIAAISLVSGSVTEWSSGNWTSHSDGQPGYRPIPIALLPELGLIGYEEYDDPLTTTKTARTFRWDHGAWQLQTAATPLASDWSVVRIAAAPGRHAIIRRDYDSGTWSFDGTTWTPLGDAIGNVSTDGSLGLGQDPTLPGLLLVFPGYAYELADGASTWAPAGPVNAPLKGYPATNFAWDARANSLVASVDFNLSIGEVVRDSTGWHELIPALLGQYYAVTDERRGTVLMTNGGKHDWELLPSGWAPAGDPPFVNYEEVPVYDPASGSVLQPGRSGREPTMLRRTLTSGAPDETCQDGEDADGDGLAGCADPDCYWACPNICPPFTVCP
jgi:hypothetical protein